MKGFLYIANRQKFIDEAIISAQSVKRFNTEPIAIVCTDELYSEKVKEIFDKVIILKEINRHTYLSKVIGMQETPFEKTIFLDSDTFITDKISELFDILDLVDFATTAEQNLHTTNIKGLSYKTIFPEFNSGVIVYRNNLQMKKVLKDWFNFCVDSKIKNDMPGLREAVLKNFNTIRFSILPDCYNEHGFSTMLILRQKVKVIHERLGYKKGIITPHFMSFKAMDAFAKKINKVEHKRLYIPKVGLISYRWSPSNIILYIKKRLGYKRVSKNR
ncbi:hypothetical protein [uncultured Marixanthomonas sp.]|uniref:hypothetical protein n=1 Tax=uncultured Marixanthomonas sp. TaxID=757245 RepID=UPI0030DADC38|tara:strand:- start:43521 stop:44339 length:819 start_codon:yes stop_codon:yes gene_type:complete